MKSCLVTGQLNFVVTLHLQFINKDKNGCHNCNLLKTMT